MAYRSHNMTLVASEGGLVSQGLLWDPKAAPDFVRRAVHWVGLQLIR